jgi:hypothetical protein
MIQAAGREKTLRRKGNGQIDREDLAMLTINMLGKGAIFSITNVVNREKLSSKLNGFVCLLV